MDCSLPGSLVREISQLRILEWVVISFSMGSSPIRDHTWVSCIGRRILYHWVTREARKECCCWRDRLSQGERHCGMLVWNLMWFRENKEIGRGWEIPCTWNGVGLICEYLSASPQHLQLLIILFRKVTKTKASSLHIPKWIQVWITRPVHLQGEFVRNSRVPLSTGS